jgi:GNAT superfamily N-acetyltransferase
VIVGKLDFEQFWRLFKKFVAFHREAGVYPAEAVPLLEMDEGHVKKDLQEMVKKAETSDDVLMIFEWRDGRMVAFFAASLESYWAGGKVANFDMIYVDEGYRGRGIGKEMIRRGLKWAEERGARLVSAHIAINNERMIEIMRGFGFVPFNVEMRKPLS